MSLRERSKPISLLSPHKMIRFHDSSPPPWYNNHAESSSTEESDHRQAEVCALAASSTPIQVHNGVSFLFNSPLKRLNRLDINTCTPQKPFKEGVSSFVTTSSSEPLASSSQSFLRPPNSPDAQFRKHCSSSEETDSEFESNKEVGNVTILEEEDTSDSDNSSDLLDCQIPPTFIRKRKHAEDSMITPQGTTNNKPFNSTCTMSGLVGNDTNDTFLKISFSTSESTPCPRQPRKKLKSNFQEDTPSQPSKVAGPLLNLTSSKKYSTSDTPLIYKLDHVKKEALDPGYCSSSSTASAVSFNKTRLSTTPISQSTPVNSRQGSPTQFTSVCKGQSSGLKESRTGINHTFETPQPKVSPLVYRALKDSTTKNIINEYHANDIRMPYENYKIVGDLPVSAAGLMDEENGDIHFADKRINDPYLRAPPDEQKGKSTELLMKYLNSPNKLPLLKHLNNDLELDEMKQLVNDGNSIRSFYDTIFSLGEHDMRDCLKKERLRWHPDKWEMKVDDSPFDMNIIGALSLVINVLLEQLR